MWQWPQSPGGMRPGRRGRGGSARLWFLAAGVLILGYLGLRALDLLSPGSQGGSAPGSPSDATGYLAQGYAQLEQASTPLSSGSLWTLWLSMIIPLAVVILAAYALLRGLRYLNARVGAPASAGRTLEALETLSLGPHGTVHLIRIGERVVVVGAGGQQLSFLTELSPEDAAAVLRAHQAASGDPFGTRGGFLQSFQDLLAGRLAQAPSAARPDSPPVDDATLRAAAGPAADAPHTQHAR
ncbi:MAG: flagellar biosynthetic protein FliO [Sphaerobacter sp.]|nr:flagellar biosynthetic protein FliO [Sphaerobacter sp.]